MSGERIVHSTELEQKFSALRINIAALDSLLVAYSGGTDSAYLAHVAHEVLGARMLAVIADSPSLPRAELAAALAFARQHSIPVETLSTHELANPQYQRNDAQRCFHCKDELFTQMETLRAERGFAHIAYGRNLDDDGDFRPGQSAAALSLRWQTQACAKQKSARWPAPRASHSQTSPPPPASAHASSTAARSLP